MWKHISFIFFTLVMFLLWDCFYLRTLFQKDEYVKGRLNQRTGYVIKQSTPPLWVCWWWC